MVAIVTVEAKPHHCGQAVHRLRPAHRRALALTGRHAHRELRCLFEQSARAYALIADGRLACLWGVQGSLLDPRGYVWMALTETALLYPRQTVREAKRRLLECAAWYHELATTILGEDRAGLSFALALGFHARDDEPETDRRRLVAKLLADESLRIPVGATFVLPLGWHAKG
jgi:hypothetical protein